MSQPCLLLPPYMQCLCGFWKIKYCWCWCRNHHIPWTAPSLVQLTASREPFSKLRSWSGPRPLRRMQKRSCYCCQGENTAAYLVTKTARVWVMSSWPGWVPQLPDCRKYCGVSECPLLRWQGFQMMAFIQQDHKWSLGRAIPIVLCIPRGGTMQNMGRLTQQSQALHHWQPPASSFPACCLSALVPLLKQLRRGKETKSKSPPNHCVRFN